MTGENPHRAMIAPVAGNAPRPLWSVMIPTYHCAGYLRETLRSVLSQDPGVEAMQIEVVDDHSTQDDPSQVVEELGRGRVVFHRQPRNVGHTRNFETCLERSRGRLVHLLHGDDFVRDGFYRRMQALFETNPGIGAAFCRHVFVDENSNQKWISDLEQPASGILENGLDRIASAQRIQTPSMVVRRDVYETLGAFDRRLSFSEDWEMWVRIASRHPIGYETAPLACYRMHAASSTARHVLNREGVKDQRRCIEVFRAHVPVDRVDGIRRRAREYCAERALVRARDLLVEGRRSVGLAYLGEAIKFSPSLCVMRSAAGILLRTRTKKKR